MRKIPIKLLYFIAFILLLIGSLRIVATYNKLTISPDELVHVTTGLELIENGTYYLEALHPPLARIMVAILPYLAGASLDKEFYNKYSHFFNNPKGYKESFEGRNLGGQQIFFSKDYAHYKKMVFLSRLGILPFFLLAGIVIFLWTKNHLGIYPALSSLFFYTTLPIILANSGLATTDMPMCALFACTIFSFSNWLNNSSLKNTIFFAISFALLTIIKFSGPIFFLIVAAPIIIAKDYATKIVSRGFELQRVISILVIILITFITIFTAYNFELSTLSYPYFLSPQKAELLKASLSNTGLSSQNIERLFSAKILPFPEFFHGLSDLGDRVAYVYAGYIFGKVLLFQGVWYFFLATTLFKTPLPFLCLMLLGSYFLCKIFFIQNNWRVIIPVLVSFILLLVSITFNMNIGLRHLLAIFPFLCICAGYSIYYLIAKKEKVTKIISYSLIISYIFATFSAHPFYVSYFNILAKDTPENILIDSDFDIGQELEYALSLPEIKNNLDDIKLYYSGLAEPKFFGFKDYVLYQVELHKRTFKIEFGNTQYLLISIPLLKLLPKEKKSVITKCKSAQKIGQTFMLYDRNKCL